MKKHQKKQESFRDQKVIVTYDPRLDNVDVNKLTSKKIARANETLKNAKLPDAYYESLKKPK